MNGILDRGASVLEDTNTIIEAHRVRAWAALAGGWRVETVEDCLMQLKDLRTGGASLRDFPL